MDRSLQGSSIHGIFQGRILEWVAISHPGDLPDPGIEPGSLASPALAGRFLTTSTTWEAGHDGYPTNNPLLHFPSNGTPVLSITHYSGTHTPYTLT